MGRGTVRTKDWVRFLKAHGCVYKRTKASHDIYKCPRCRRSITVVPKHKEVPIRHLHTSLITLNKDFDYLYEWLDNN